MSFDWMALAPHKPLKPGAQSYVEPVSGGGEAVAARVLAGGSTVLVGGPAGIGKSTAIAQAARLLQKDRVVCLVPLDRWENLRRLTADRLLLRIAVQVVGLATEVLRLGVSEAVRSLVERATLRLQSPGAALASSHQERPDSVAHDALLEVARLSKQKRIALLIDGLDTGELTRRRSSLRSEGFPRRWTW